MSLYTESCQHEGIKCIENQEINYFVCTTVQNLLSLCKHVDLKSKYLQAVNSYQIYDFNFFFNFDLGLKVTFSKYCLIQ